MSQTFLVVRREDLVVLGVRWSGFELRHDAAGPASRSRLVAVSDDAFVMLIFPPQAIVEGKFQTPSDTPGIVATPAGTVQCFSKLAGSSQLVFKVQTRTPIDLTAEGILQALATSGSSARIVPFAAGEHLHPEDVSSEDARLVLDHLNAAQTAQEIAAEVEIPFERDVGFGIAQRILDRRQELGGSFTDLHQVRAVPLVGPERFTEIVTTMILAGGGPDAATLGRGPATVIEIPWRLFMVPIPRGSSKVVSDHSARPVGRSGVFGLWHARLRASNGGATDARLPLLPLGSLPDEPEEHTKFRFSPLSQRDREAIVRLGQRRPPIAKRLELSALGGSLSATGRWPSFEWDHDATLGRDQRVRVIRKGLLCPLGCRTEYEVVTERRFIEVFDPTQPPPNDHHPPPDDDDPPPPFPPRRFIAGLHTRRTLFVLEPVRQGLLAAGFPFSEVEILRDHFIVDDPVDDDVFTPRQGGTPLRFPLRCAAADGDVYFAMPLIFVSDNASATSDEQVLASRLKDELKANGDVDLPGTQINLVHSPSPPEPRPSDVHEVHQLSFIGDWRKPAIPPCRPKLSQFKVKLPALRTLLPADPKHNEPQELEYSKLFLEGGDPDIALVPVAGKTINVDFTRSADRSGGLVSPAFKVDGISRRFGPVDTHTLPAPPRRLPPASTFLARCWPRR